MTEVLASGEGIADANVSTADANRSRGLAAPRPAPAIFPIDGLNEELPPGQHLIARVMRGHVREITLIVRNAEQLQIGLTRGPCQIEQPHPPGMATRVSAYSLGRRRGYVAIEDRFHG